jgi:hypothetical protein
MGRKPIILSKNEIQFIEDHIKTNKHGNLSNDFNTKFKKKISMKTLLKKYKENTISLNYQSIKKTKTLIKRKIKLKKHYELNKENILSKLKKKYKKKKNEVLKKQIDVYSTKEFNICNRLKNKCKNVSYKLKTTIYKIKKRYKLQNQGKPYFFNN